MMYSRRNLKKTEFVSNWQTSPLCNNLRVHVAFYRTLWFYPVICCLKRVDLWRGVGPLSQSLEQCREEGNVPQQFQVRQPENIINSINKWDITEISDTLHDETTNFFLA